MTPAVAVRKHVRTRPDDGLLDYRRGVLHGIQAAATVAWHYDEGRSWSAGEVANQIEHLTTDIPATCVIIGDCLNEYDELRKDSNVLALFRGDKAKRSARKTRPKK